MPLNISPQGTTEKNKIASTGAWLLLFEFIYKNEEPIRVCLNNEEIMWNGEKWYPAIFSVSAITETKESEVNSIPFSIVDINRRLTPIIDKYNGAVGAVVYMRTVHSNHLNLTEPEREDRFEVVKANIDHGNKITFTLGQENLINRRCPTHRYFKNYCRFKFKSDLCGYSGPETECSLTFARCRVLGNQKRFGGFPGVGREGFFIL
jgi:phage-related protein